MEDDPRAHVVNNYVVLRCIFGHLPDAASVTSCSRVLPCRTPWGRAAAAEARDRSRRAAPALFCVREDLLLEESERRLMYDGGRAKLHRELRRTLALFCEGGELRFEPALALSSSAALSAEIQRRWPALPVVPVPGKSTILGEEVSEAPAGDDTTMKHWAIFLPAKEDVDIVSFELSQKDAASGKPILPIIMGPRFTGKIPSIKSLLIFYRVSRSKIHTNLIFLLQCYTSFLEVMNL